MAVNWSTIDAMRDPPVPSGARSIYDWMHTGEERITFGAARYEIARLVAAGKLETGWQRRNGRKVRVYWPKTNHRQTK